MIRRLPKRFSLRFVFIVVTSIALGLVGFLEWHRFQTARYDYEHAVAKWQFQIATFKDTVGAADKLYKAESEILWIPWQTATQWQVERLSYLANRARTSVLTTMFSGDGRERLLRECDQVEAKASKLAAELRQ